MSESLETRVRRLMESVDDPGTGRSVADSGWLRAVGGSDGRVSVDLRLGYPADGVREGLSAAVREALEADPDIDEAVVNLSWRVTPRKVQQGLEPHPGIANIIAVASGKGGVGKSTVAVNLALGLASEGARVGLLDADIYGPSIPRMCGVSGRPDTDGKRIVPKQAHGLKLMSIGFLVDEDTPMIWRGPMVTSALQQLLGETDWGPLDYLVVDLPPGTGDIQLTLAQKVPVAGAVIVTTPQDIALLDARKALQMFRKVRVPVLGLVENMSMHVCPECGHKEPLFGDGGGVAMAEEYQVPLLGRLPLSRPIREALDAGAPTMAAAPDSPEGELFRACARRVAGELSQQPRSESAGLPGIVVQNR